jgi:hypothetical protein
VIASFRQLDCSAASATLLITIFLCDLEELLLILVLLADVVLSTLIEHVLAANTRQLSASVILTDGVCDLGRPVGHMCGGLQKLAAARVATVHTESFESQ